LQDIWVAGLMSGILLRAIPIAYFCDGINFFIVVSNWGRRGGSRRLGIREARSAPSRRIFI